MTLYEGREEEGAECHERVHHVEPRGHGGRVVVLTAHMESSWTSAVVLGTLPGHESEVDVDDFISSGAGDLVISSRQRRIAVAEYYNGIEFGTGKPFKIFQNRNTLKNLLNTSKPS